MHLRYWVFVRRDGLATPTNTQNRSSLVSANRGELRLAGIFLNDNVILLLNAHNVRIFAFLKLRVLSAHSAYSCFNILLTLMLIKYI